ncbi:MAG: insulinase family protein, partial [Chitinophagaceae bacterium]
DKYYHPNNSLLVIAGDVKHDEAFAMARRIYGDWKHSGFDPHQKYPIPDFPPIKSSETYIKESPLAQTPYVFFNWQGPGFSFDSAGTIYADVLSQLLKLNSSKWQQALIDKGLASSADLSYQTLKHTGSVDIFAVPTPDKMKQFYTAIQDQLRQMSRDEYFTDDQLKTAKEIIRRNQIRQREKPSELSKNVTYNWCSTSYEYLTDYEKNCMNVTRDDIKKFINRYINGKPFIAGMIINPEMNKSLNPTSFFKPFN